jgi:predicted GNAT family acetyltransferase
MAKKTRIPSPHRKSGKAKRLAKAAVGLAASALLERALQKAAEDPRVRRKTRALGRAVVRRAKAAGTRIGRVVKPRRKGRSQAKVAAR